MKLSKKYFFENQKFNETVIVFSFEGAFWNLLIFNIVTRYIFSIAFHGISYNIKLLPFTLKMDTENTNK